jgi:PhoPQ-activated pathogenicity-related protein
MPSLNYAALRGLAERIDETSQEDYYTTDNSNYHQLYQPEMQYPEYHPVDQHYDGMTGYAQEQGYSAEAMSSPYAEGQPLPNLYSSLANLGLLIRQEEFRLRCITFSTETCKAIVNCRPKTS